MEMTDQHVVNRLLDGARLGRAAVTAELTGEPYHPPADYDLIMSAANFLGYTMFAVQIANGLHPRTGTDFVSGDGRGAALARSFLASGTVEICCDYCGELMTQALTGAAAAQMRTLHGDQAPSQWESLMFALTGPPF